MRRLSGEWVAFDNAVERGEIPLIGTVKLDNTWVEADPDILGVVATALDKIAPSPSPVEGTRRRYFWGSGGLTAGLLSSPDAPPDRCDLIGMIPTSVTDAELAATVTANGGRTHYSRPFWKTQYGETLRILKFSQVNFATLVKDYSGTLTKYGRSLLESPELANIG